MPIINNPNTNEPGMEIFTGVADSMLRDSEPTGLFVAESLKVISRALASGAMPYAMLTDRKWLDDCHDVIDAILKNDPAAPIYVVDSKGFATITGYKIARGPVAVFKRPELPNLRELCAEAKRIAVLENINNYTNVGAIFRSAAALGIDAVLITPSTHDPLYRRAARVSMGTVFQVPWTRIGGAPKSSLKKEKSVQKTESAVQSKERLNAKSCPKEKIDDKAWPKEGLDELKSLGFTTLALALTDDSIPIDDPRLSNCEKLALIMGSEGDGLSHQTLACCDYSARIPMMHGVDSLNVAAASAVAFWELRYRA